MCVNFSWLVSTVKLFFTVSHKIMASLPVKHCCQKDRQCWQQRKVNNVLYSEQQGDKNDINHALISNICFIKKGSFFHDVIKITNSSFYFWNSSNLLTSGRIHDTHSHMKIVYRFFTLKKTFMLNTSHSLKGGGGGWLQPASDYITLL